MTKRAIIPLLMPLLFGCAAAIVPGPPDTPPPSDGRQVPSPPAPPMNSSPLPSCSPLRQYPTPAVVPSSPVTVGNLTGDWYGAEQDMAAGPMYLCNFSARYILSLRQDGETLSGTLKFRSYVGLGVFQHPEVFTGENVGGVVSMSGVEKVPPRAQPPKPEALHQYRLQFNEETQHLEGFRDAQPVWLIPIVYPDCPPSPENTWCWPVP